MTGLAITSIGFTPAPANLRDSGLHGWITAVLNDTLVVDGITLRRTLGGRRVLSFPARTDRSGRQHPVLRPVNDEARRDIERQVLAALGIDAGTEVPS